jgi:ABC-type transporter Mla maintaining outer membrane lipid asymmetry ATPase subunit MlaF
MTDTAVLEITGLEKAYGGLRPLRVQSLQVLSGTLVAVVGLDAPAAEMFTNLATGAILPDRGDVRLFGQSTAAVTNPDDWLKLLDRVGIVTDRAVLLDTYTVAQNLVMPLTLDVDPLSSELARTAAVLAGEVGLENAALDRPVSALGAPDRLRVRFGRALALSPALLLMEHPTATLQAVDVAAFAADVGRVVRSRRLAAVAMTADLAFAEAATPEVRELRPADGVLQPRARAWGRVRRLFTPEK